MRGGSAGRERNYGIDLLRLVSMVYVVLLHTLTQGGLLAAAPRGTLNYGVVWLLYAWAQGAVDIFALISGYVSYTDRDRPVNYGSYLLLWLQVAFYGGALTLAGELFRPQWSNLEDLVNSLLPLVGGRYWYFNVYTGLVIVMPLLNAGLRRCGEATLRKLFLASFLAFSLFEALIGRYSEVLGGRFSMGMGYSFPWICLLYCMGAMMKKCALGSRLSTPQALLGIVGLTGFAWVWKLLDPHLWTLSLWMGGDVFLSYISPAVLASAILHLILFSRLRLPKGLRRAVSFAAPGAFAVYLLNVHRVVWEHVMACRFAPLAQGNPLRLIAGTVGFSFLFMVLSVTVDRVRQAVFARLGLPRLAQGAADRAREAVDRLSKLL